MELNQQEIVAFSRALWAAYERYGRPNLPWRLPEPGGQFDPYKIMVSELMLQQTQVARVIPKYHEFLQAFPTIQTLAAASLGDVLRRWQGLGYNRRAKYIWQGAQAIQTLGAFPRIATELVKLPGIGPNTVGAIVAYAYNEPATFIETNIRTVYIHHFFTAESIVTDKEILGLVEQTLDRERPREFYWALMDYGAHLKATVGNLNVASKHYAKQSRFQGSHRQLRGQVIHLLGARAYSLKEIRATIADDRLEAVLSELANEDMIHKIGDLYGLE